MRWALLVTLLAGCIDAQVVTCPGDVVCPQGTQCDTVHGGCITPDQASACVGLADHTTCRAGDVIGYCLDQICVDPGCGNHIVDPGELCDDGNRSNGDGCSATCASREQCGDGAVDPALGEQCDDGNLQSHDGCDSRCQIETATWTVEPLGPATAQAHWTIYDPQLGKIVMVADGNVWAWDGTRWTVAASGGPRIGGDYSVVYDTARSRIVVIAAHPPSGDGIDPNPPRDQIYEWDGTTWTMATATGAQACSAFVAAYDSVRHNVLGFCTDATGAARAATYNVTTHAWTATPQISAFNTLTSFTMAFDDNRGVAVLVGSLATGPVVGEWNGTGWATKTTSLTAGGGWSAFYDPSIAQVVVVGTNAATGPTPVESWSGMAWASLTAVDQTRYQPAVAYDQTRNVRFVFGGGAGYPDSVSEGTGSTWTPVARTTSPPGVDRACSFDEARARLVCAGAGDAGNETWTYNGTWSLLGSADELAFALAYDPVRGAIVAPLPGQLAVLGDTGWQPITVAGLTAPAFAVTFDPTARQLVVSTTQNISGASTTVLIDEQDQTQSFAGPTLTSLAFDARNHAVVATTTVSTLQLSGQTWIPIVGPGASFAAVTNARRGTVELVGPPHDVERVGEAWLDEEPSPFILAGSATFAQSTGDLYEVGADGISRFLLRRHWDSATPFEDCAGSGDLDGDGLAGCDDPDCWTQCQACPPLTSCP